VKIRFKIKITMKQANPESDIPIEIAQKERTINGKMRSFYIADKNTFSVSWQNLPSRSFSNLANFNNSTGAKDAGLDNYTEIGRAHV
jgi:hypothetical protein